MMILSDLLALCAPDTCVQIGSYIGSVRKFSKKDLLSRKVVQISLDGPCLTISISRG